MNELILQYGTSFSIVVRLLSIILLLFFCIPLQIREVTVKNGLKILRIQLLSFGILLLFVNIITLLLLLDVTNQPAHLPNSWLQVVNALAFLGISFIANRIYNSQYTDISKEIHRQIANQNKED